MSRARAALTLSLVLAFLGTPAFAQSAMPSSSNLRIRVVGALLGQVEGFCEDPGGPYDWLEPIPKECGSPNGERQSRWLGGALGVKALPSPPSVAQDWLVLAGNNQSARPGAGPFWTQIVALKPTVIGLGEEDFLRTQSTTGSAKAMFDWVRASPQLPLLASNAVVRRTKPTAQLNEIRPSKGYELHLDTKATVSWLSDLKLQHPSSAKLEASLMEFPTKPTFDEPGVPARQPKIKPGSNGADATIELVAALRPGHWYRLTISDTGVGRVVVTAIFETDAALTPLRDDRSRFAGFPVVAHGDVVAVALVNPDAKKLLTDEAWKWKTGEAVHEIAFLSPEDTLSALLQRARDGQEGTQAPPVLLLSELTDAQTTELIKEFPEVRFVVLHPESGLLGRGSRSEARRVTVVEPEPTRFSGDFGFASVLDHQYPTSTRVMVRPEWFGETQVTIDATLQPFGISDWKVLDASTHMRIVPGTPFFYDLVGEDVRYLAGERGNATEVETDRSYFQCGANDPRDACVDFKDLWSSAVELTLLFGDALRREQPADIAAVSKELIDVDYAGYIKRELDRTENRTGWLSRYILERLVYRSPRMIRVYVSGSTLFETLQKILKSDGGFCLSGIALSCPATLDAEHPERLRVNGRAIDHELIYVIVLPDHVAEALGLPHSDAQRARDVVSAADDYLHARRWLVRKDPALPSLAARLQQRSNRTIDGHIKLATLDVGLTKIEPNDPAGREGVRKNLGLGFSGAKESRTLSVDLAGEVAYLDWPRFAIRSPVAVKYVRRTESDDVSYDTDEFSLGWRVEGKFGLLRPYGGYFGDGQLEPHVTRLTAVRSIGESTNGSVRTEKAGFKTIYAVPPRRFWQIACGVDFVPLRSYALGKGLSAGVKTLGARLGRGSESGVPTRVTIGGVEQSLDALASQGSQALLNTYFEEHSEIFTGATPFEITSDPADQWRVQLDADGDLKFKPKVREYTAEIKGRYRKYEAPGPSRSGFQLSAESRLEIKLGIPLFWRFKLVPSYQFQRARIEDEENNEFTFHRLDLKVSLPVVLRAWRVWTIK